MAVATVQGIQSLKPQTKYTKHSIGDGLFIGISTNGTKNWIIRYSIDGKQRDYRPSRPFGLKSDEAYLSLADAKHLAATIRAQAKQGIDYQAQQIIDAAKAEALALSNASEALTVNQLYSAWIETNKRKDGGEALRRSFTKDVLPSIGNLKLNRIEEKDIRELLKPLAEADKNRTAEVTLNNLKQMFRWGLGRKPWKLVIDNPVENLKSEDVTAKGHKTTERNRVLSDAEIIQLKEAVTAAELFKTTETAIWLTLSCCTRIGETVKTEWSHLDLDAGIWILPAANTKNNETHTVYLSAFAINEFKKLKKHTGNSQWCFPNRDDTFHICPKAPTKQIKDRQRKKPLLNRSKFNQSLIVGEEPWTMHDLRRTGSTLLQKFGIAPHIIERALNHKEQNKLARVYQHHDYKEEMTEAWRLLGNHIEKLL